MMDGRGRRNKGKRGERKVVNEIKKVFPEFADDLRRGWQSRQGDDDPDVVGLPGAWVEVKFGKLPNPRAALAQAIRDSAGKKVTPVAVIIDNRKPPFVVLTLADFLPMYRKVLGLEKPHERGNQGRRWRVLRTVRGWRVCASADPKRG